MHSNTHTHAHTLKHAHTHTPKTKVIHFQILLCDGKRLATASSEQVGEVNSACLFTLQKSDSSYCHCLLKFLFGCRKENRSVKILLQKCFQLRFVMEFAVQFGKPGGPGCLCLKAAIRSSDPKLAS